MTQARSRTAWRPSTCSPPSVFSPGFLPIGSPGAVTRPDDDLVLTAGDTLVLSGLPEPLALAEAKLLRG